MRWPFDRGIGADVGVGAETLAVKLEAVLEISMSYSSIQRVRNNHHSLVHGLHGSFVSYGTLGIERKSELGKLDRQFNILYL